MGVPFSEFGKPLEAFQFGGSYTTPGNTISEDFNVFPGEVIIHVGLARVAASEAVIGIARIARPRDQEITFGSHATWETAAYGQVSGFTIAVFVARGLMKGWFSVQACR